MSPRTRVKHNSMLELACRIYRTYIKDALAGSSVPCVKDYYRSVFC